VTPDPVSKRGRLEHWRAWLRTRWRRLAAWTIFISAAAAAGVVLFLIFVFAIACGFIIPIPWVYRWMMNWFASQTELAPRGSL